MAEFRYVAIAPGGALARGSMEAPDSESVIERLRRSGHLPISATEARRHHALGDFFSTEIGRRGALSREERMESMRELASMLGAGQDLDHALRFLVETAPSRRVSTIFARLRQAVRDGRTLSAAMSGESKSFPRLMVGLVRAGEAGGALGPALERLAQMLEREQRLAAAVLTALLYPSLLLLTAIGSVTLLLTLVLPQFVPLFAENGVPIPISTRLMLAVGAWISAFGPYALVFLLLAAMVVRRALARPGPRAQWDRLVLRLPVVGRLAREAMAARFTRTLGTLLVNGVPLVPALGIVREATGNRAGVAALERAIASVRGGGGLAAPLQSEGIFPRRTVSLLRLGEETAALGPVALRAADIHDEQVRLGVDRLVAVLVPAITIAMGVLVAAIVGSLLQAMLGLDALAQ